ncbi:alpha/beta hydrolase family protein [Nocardia blacklockiae]|uniref:alpha/beta hydrolase family protein n=1 Tax=Nocardia blacklockiae TaxID=480036 RepID=UPI0018934B97|nr:alpha/beta fold hydrolase [Nocardia blacklockiae]MBF6174198.1 alpha/beta fold hydrolase [Nocardia blacklockiae]
MRSLRSLALLLFVVALAGACSTSGTPIPAPSTAERALTGDWHGTLPVPEHPLPLGVTFSEDGATVSIPLQGVYDRPLDQVSLRPDEVGFTIARLPGTPTFRGRYDRAADTITGTFTQSGQELPLTFERGEVPAVPRPQEPKPPFPYLSEDVTFPSGALTVAGTLTLPTGPGPYPAAVLITGSGPQDRNEELLGHKPFLLLADTLTRAGYAVLRTDDRGVGGTGGALDRASYQDLADDVVAGMRFLRGRPDIDKDRIGLLGHSEGGYLAPLVAARPDSGVAFVIMMAGPAATGADVLMEQNRVELAATGASVEETRDRVEFLSTLTTLVRSGDTEQVRRYLTERNAQRPPDRRLSPGEIDEFSSLYFASLITYDPAPALSALRMPVLAFYGGKDWQVPPAQSEPLARQQLAADPDADIHVFDGLNHLMQPADTGNPAEYPAIETTIAPEVLDYVTGWLTQRVPPGR